jgi:uncharacterized repeat protein (TIGR03803 family)
MTTRQATRRWAARGRRQAAVSVVLSLAGIVAPPLLSARSAPAPPVQGYSVLYTFTAGTDGEDPVSGLIVDSTGNLYGTTERGGDGFGVVFKLDQFGKETVLYTFTGGSDGGLPFAGLTRNSAGNLYGTTAGGGNTGTSCGASGCGVVFRVSPAGEETVLYSFRGGSDGGIPLAGVILDSGHLFGTTSQGGNAGSCGGSGCGVVFELNGAGKETVLYSFMGGSDGSFPSSDLIRDSANNLYGTTQGGGDFSGSCAANGCGVIFSLGPDGNETVLYSFGGGADGAYPHSGLVRDSAGNLYGTTPFGGDFAGTCSSNGCGVVFELDQAGNETVLYTFTDGADGGQPFAGLKRDATGYLYGTAVVGGSYELGAVFKVSPAGAETVLYSFTGGADGSEPLAGVTSFSGYLYGTTQNGGTTNGGCKAQMGCGVVFKVKP